MWRCARRIAYAGIERARIECRAGKYLQRWQQPRSCSSLNHASSQSRRLIGNPMRANFVDAANGPVQPRVRLKTDRPAREPYPLLGQSIN